MQAYTHFLIAIYLHQLLLPMWPNYPAALVAFLQHPLLDIIAIATYHPSQPHNDFFWIGYHFSIWVFTVWILYRFSQYWWVMLFSVLIDIWDWGLIRGLNLPLSKIHPVINEIRQDFPLPDWTEEWWAAFPELFIAGWLYMSIQ